MLYISHGSLVRDNLKGKVKDGIFIWKEHKAFVWVIQDVAYKWNQEHIIALSELIERQVQVNSA
jgi:hypothetical protein